MPTQEEHQMPDERHIRPFAEWLHEQRGGLLQSELSDALNELVEAVTEHGNAGALTLTVKVKPAGKGSVHTLLVSDDVKLKKPFGERSESIFYADNDSNLSRRDPRQLELEGLREVPKPEVNDDESKAEEA